MPGCARLSPQEDHTITLGWRAGRIRLKQGVETRQKCSHGRVDIKCTARFHHEAIPTILTHEFRAVLQSFIHFVLVFSVILLSNSSEQARGIYSVT